MLIVIIAAAVMLVIGVVIGFLIGKSLLQSRLAASETARTVELKAAAEQRELLLKQLEDQKTASADQLQKQQALQNSAAEQQLEQLKKSSEEALQNERAAAEQQLEQLKKSSEETLQAERSAAEKMISQLKKSNEEALQTERTAAEQQLAQLKKSSEETLQAERSAAEKMIGQLKKSNEEALQTERTAAEQQKEMYVQQLADQKKQYDEQRAELEKQMLKQVAMQQENAQKQYELLKEEFKTLAGKVLAEKSADFEKNGKTQLDILLAPLKSKLEEFKNTTELSRKEAFEINAKLSAQIGELMKSSQALGEDAVMLAKALRSDNKMLGNWGEMILDEILASSGLVEKVHYHKQLMLKDDDNKAIHNDDTGKKMIPDVVVNYPDGKMVIIDSKVSLTDYIDWVNSNDPGQKQLFAEKHLKSVKAHMDGLAAKNYPAHVRKADVEAAEFVIMFMPNAGAYELAMHLDINLWRTGFDKKVLLVSPANLMALLQLIHVGWTRYEQDRNQLKILDSAGQLVDRLGNFLKEFNKVGDSLESAGNSFKEAAGVLRGDGGKHSIIKKGEELQKLGAKVRKRLAIPKRFMDDDAADENAAEVIEIDTEAADNAVNE